MMKDILQSFNDTFNVILVDSPDLLQNVYRLRYEVLCLEKRLPDFNISQYPNKLEIDEYDSHSAHILLQHRSSGIFIGTVRLILSDPTYPEKEFPIEKHMCIDKNLLETKKLPRYHTAEISRFLVGKYFLGRQPVHNLHKNKSTKCKFIKERKFFPHPILGLALGIGRMSFVHNISHLLCVMDPALNKLLGYYGLNFVPIGPLANYHGLRRPYYFDTKLVSKKRHENFQNIWKLITDRKET